VDGERVILALAIDASHMHMYVSVMRAPYVIRDIGHRTGTVNPKVLKVNPSVLLRIIFR